MYSLSPGLSDEHALGLTTAALAQVGDAVYELMVRTRLCAEGTAVTARRLHSERVARVNASAQGGAAARIAGLLSEDERAVFLRGRNSKTHAAPKGASARDYRAATAVEALWGWLWLTGRRERLETLFAAAYSLRA
ncbi:MAG: ribonuclease III [Oscillospiraceae bacterium]|jgi:ribonuclease-3 family protein|nr:ribonuclease III [Oscillospiraceae bacterium]